jgi:hypothetical protein
MNYYKAHLFSTAQRLSPHHEPFQKTPTRMMLQIMTDHLLLICSTVPLMSDDRLEATCSNTAGSAAMPATLCIVLASVEVSCREARTWFWCWWVGGWCVDVNGVNILKTW